MKSLTREGLQRRYRRTSIHGAMHRRIGSDDHDSRRVRNPARFLATSNERTGSALSDLETTAQAVVKGAHWWSSERHAVEDFWDPRKRREPSPCSLDGKGAASVGES